MRKTTLILFWFCLLLQASAQEKIKIREVGLSLSNFNNFGIVYRFGNERAVWRFSSVNTFIRQAEIKTLTAVNNTIDMSIGLRFGREFRTTLGRKNQLRWGADISYRYSRDLTEFSSLSTDMLDRTDRLISNFATLHMVIGMNFPIGHRLLLGVEILPSFVYQFGSEFRERVNVSTVSDQDFSRYEFNLVNDGAIVVFTYAL